MSNNAKPTLGLKVPPPPPVAAPVKPPVEVIQPPTESGIRENFADLLIKYPTPWVVGPFGDIWVAADVEQFDPDIESGHEKIPGPNGTWWRTTKESRERGKPRLVAEVSEVEDMHKDMAAFIVAAVNALDN